MQPDNDHQLIANELTAMAAGKHRSWGQLAGLVDRVERSGYWQGKGASFTDWLEGLSSTLGLRPATLWRFLSAGRFYASLRHELLEGGISAPPLEELPNTVSPENLELLLKLRRVAPREVSEPIAARVLSGTITRADLRSTWQAYRPALGGRTARGRGVKPPKVDMKDVRHFNSMVEAEVFTGLKYGSKTWTGTANPHTFQIYMNVKPEFGPYDKFRFQFDAVVAVRCSAEDPLILHGFDIRSEFSLYAERSINFFELASPFCDRLWTAIHETTQGLGEDVAPECVGVVVARSQSIRVLRGASGSGNLSSRSGDLAKGLLFSAPAQ